MVADLSAKGSLVQALYNQSKKIHDDDIREFFITVLDNAPAGFWKVPCSSSGKYHPPEDQGEGGLIRHLIKCGKMSLEFARFYYDFSEENLKMAKRNTDIVFTAASIHDIQKNGIPWTEHTDYSHGKIAYDWLEQFKLKQPEKDEIRNCVRYHMWKWVQPDTETARATNPTLNESIVQLADYVSSRKCDSFLPGVSLPEEVIESYSKHVPDF
jgi:hypothetical protein